MRLLLLSLSLFVFASLQAQTLLPKLSILADSNITEVSLTKVYLDYIPEPKGRDPKQRIDSGSSYLEYVYTINRSGKISSLLNYNQGGDTALYYKFGYNELGEVVEQHNLRAYFSKEALTTLTRTDDGGFLEQTWRDAKLTQVKRYNADSILVEDRYYRGEDSIINLITINPGNSETWFYNQGKLVQHHQKAWKSVDGQLAGYTELEESYNSKKKRMVEKHKLSFGVLADSSLKLRGWYKDNYDYTSIRYANWFTKLEPKPIQYEDLFRLDEFIYFSPEYFQLVTFSGAGYHYRYKISYR
ncbi:MAG: hypothetical protein EP332_10140 [Bacteroidetes bacterium]|nr:MAG: hypothetical protein EP332_10140 [Bacteroidota bacterium]